jgi:quercetin dioxygenase-like cupin family protein
MRVSPRDLRGIRAEGLLTRFVVLGPVAFVSVEIPPEGSAGTGLDRHAETEAWGLTLRGTTTLHTPDGATEFPMGSAFHVPLGVEHWWSAGPRAILAGFAPMPADTDLSEAALRERGYEPIQRIAPPPPMPSRISPVGPSATLRPRGSIEVEIAEMGRWVFSRATFGALSGYTTGWCDLPHWGIVLAGDLALRFENEVELLSAGDVYYCPAGPPGHQFQVPDSATTIDYTPYADLIEPGRKASWRVSAFGRLAKDGAATGRSATGVRAGGSKRSGKARDSGPGASGDSAAFIAGENDAPAGGQGPSPEGGAPARPGTRRNGLRWVRTVPAVALRNLRIG